MGDSRSIPYREGRQKRRPPIEELRKQPGATTKRRRGKICSPKDGRGVRGESPAPLLQIPQDVGPFEGELLADYGDISPPGKSGAPSVGYRRTGTQSASLSGTHAELSLSVSPIARIEAPRGSPLKKKKRKRPPPHQLGGDRNIVYISHQDPRPVPGNAHAWAPPPHRIGHRKRCGETPARNSRRGRRLVGGGDGRGDSWD